MIAGERRVLSWPRAAWLLGLVLLSACATEAAGDLPPGRDGGCLSCGDGAMDASMPPAAMDGGPQADALVTCAPLQGVVDAGAGRPRGIYPDPRFAATGANVAMVKTACVDTSALPSHAKLDALVEGVLSEAGLASAPLGSCSCDWTLRFGPPSPLGGAAGVTFAAGAKSDELYAEVTALLEGRLATALYAKTERGGLYALRAAAATATAAGGGAMVPESTVVDYPEIQARGFIDGVYGTLGGWPTDSCGYGDWPGPFASWPSRFSPGMRSEILRLIGRLRGNTFIYGPKADPFDRGPCNGTHKNWADPYTLNDGMQSMVQTLAVDADANLVDLYWSLSPFPGFDWSNPGPSGPGFAAVRAKIDGLRTLGIHHFAMFVDDARVNGGTPQENAVLMNATQAYVRSLDPTDHLIVVTWAYAGGPSGATDAYGAALDKAIEVMWTGPAVEPCTIRGADMSAPNQSYQRTLSIWDNWPAPAVDSGCAVDMRMTGRSDDLPGAIRGYYTNPVINEAGHPLGDELPHLGPVMDYAWGASHYNADVGGSYARWASLLPAWQSAVHPCANTSCTVPSGAFEGFACDPSHAGNILFCDPFEGHCMTTLRCPKGCSVQASAQDTCD